MSKEIEGEVSLMCNLSQGIFEEGEAKGKAKGNLDAIRNLMKNLHLTAENAMTALEIPETDRAAYLEKLKS